MIEAGIFKQNQYIHKNPHTKQSQKQQKHHLRTQILKKPHFCRISTIYKSKQGTWRLKFWSLCIELSSSDPNEVNLLFDRSKLSNLDSEVKAGGNSTNLLFATFIDINAFKELISVGNVFILLNERSRYSRFVKHPISGGRYLQSKTEDNHNVRHYRHVNSP
jgi:hypothetical protein